MRGTIVIGMAASTESRSALDWALRRAERDGDDVRAVYVADPSATDGHPLAVRADQDHGTLVLAREAFLAHEKAPHVAFATELRNGRPDEVLLQVTRDARLLVVGAHSSDSLTEDWRRSPAVGVAARASCPVVVVPVARPGRHGVVVGIDGSPEGDRGLSFAAQEAAALGEPLTVVTCWWSADAWIPGFVADDTYRSEMIAAAQDILDGALLSVRQAHPDLVCEGRIAHGETAPQLAAIAEDALELVVGTRGRHGVIASLLGSTARELLHRPRCPVVVVPPAR